MSALQINNPQRLLLLGIFFTFEKRHFYEKEQTPLIVAFYRITKFCPKYRITQKDHATTLRSQLLNGF